MIKISCIHPSFGRPAGAFNNMLFWMRCAKHPEEVEYIIGLDDNDPSIPEYQKLAKYYEDQITFGKFVLDIGDSRSGVAAMNRMATKLSDTTELIVGTADDMSSINDWDIELMKLLDGVNNQTEPKIIYVSDGVHPYQAVIVYLIVNKAWYNRFGYLLYPEYNGVFADNDMHEVAKRINAIIEAPQLLFQHRHYIVGMSPRDATYNRNNNSTSWARNEEVYRQRASRNFDL